MKQVRVGVGILILHNDKILIGKRKNSHGNGKFGFPGGHLEFGESIEDCVIREAYEETSLKIEVNNIEIFNFTNDIMYEDEKHYITIFPKVIKFTGDVKNMEPDKLEAWQWMSWDEIKNLGDQSFLPIQNLIKKYPDSPPFK